MITAGYEEVGVVCAEEEWVEQSKPGACPHGRRGESSRPEGFQPSSHTYVPTGYSSPAWYFVVLPLHCCFVAGLLKAEAQALSSHRKDGCAAGRKDAVLLGNVAFGWEVGPGTADTTLPPGAWLRKEGEGYLQRSPAGLVRGWRDHTGGEAVCPSPSWRALVTKVQGHTQA